MLNKSTLLFTISVLLILIPIFIKAKDIADEKKIIVVFRYDDYSNNSDTKFEKEIIALFKKYNFECAFGVIPYDISHKSNASIQDRLDSLSTYKLGILKNAINEGIIEVALHGYSHRNIYRNSHDIFKIEYNSEFFGLKYESQFSKIAKGKYFLEKNLQEEITIFIPPWNSYDLNTIRALEEQNFKYISANGSGNTYNSSSLNYLPTTCTLNQLHETVKFAREHIEAEPIILVMFHQYELENINELKNAFEWIELQGDINVKNFHQVSTISDLSAKHYLQYHLFTKLLKALPQLMQKKYSTQVYFSYSYLKMLNSTLFIVVVLFYLILLIITSSISYLGGLFIYSKSKKIATAIKYIGLFCIAIASIVVYNRYIITFKYGFLFILVLGIYLGLQASYFRIKKGLSHK